MRAATVATFRAFSRIEEQMIRAAMPRTAAADPAPLPAFAAEGRLAVATRGASRLVRPCPALTATVAELLEARRG